MNICFCPGKPVFLSACARKKPRNADIPPGGGGRYALRRAGSAAAEAHHQLAGGGGIEGGDALGAGDLEDHVAVGLYLLHHRAVADLPGLAQGVVGRDHQLAVDLPVLPFLVILQRTKVEGQARQRGRPAQIVAEGRVDLVPLAAEHGIGHGGIEGGGERRASGKGVHRRALGKGHRRPLGKGGDPSLGPRKAAAAAGAEVRGVLHLIAALRAEHGRFLSFVGVSARRAAPESYYQGQYSTPGAKHQALRGLRRGEKSRVSGEGKQTVPRKVSNGRDQKSYRSCFMETCKIRFKQAFNLKAGNFIEITRLPFIYKDYPVFSRFLWSNCGQPRMMSRASWIRRSLMRRLVFLIL